MTRKQLESVFWLTKKLKMWQDRLAELQADIALSPKVLDGMPFQNTNATSDPTYIKAMKLAEVSKVIEGKISEIQIAVMEVEEYIVSIEDSELQTILEYRCVKCQSWQDIAKILGNGYSDEAIRQKYHRFVTNLD